MRFLTFSLAVAGAFCLAACGNVIVDSSGTTGSGAGTTGSGAGTTGTGGSTTATGGSTTSGCGGSTAGDCQTDADCMGGTCAPLTPGGYLVCLDVAPPATSCAVPKTPMDQCCTSADCKGGKACYSTGVLTLCLGGPPPEIYNACVSDQCQSDADCAAGTAPAICAPAGAFNYPLRECFTAYCRTDADCTAQPCGACVTVSQPCCGVPAGLACVYPGGCSKNADCGQGSTCQIDPAKGAGVCTTAQVICPV